MVQHNPPMDRFLKNIEVDPSGCWIWTGYLSAGRYGSFRVNGKQVKAHRWIYAEKHGAIPMGKVICHTCDNTKCVNPDHLWMGSQNDNVQDCITKGRDSHPSGFKRTKGKLFGDDNPSRKHPETRPRGEVVNTCKLTADMVLEIRHLHDEKGMSQYRLAKLFNVSQPNIGCIVRRISWKHI